MLTSRKESNAMLWTPLVLWQCICPRTGEQMFDDLESHSQKRYFQPIGILEKIFVLFVFQLCVCFACQSWNPALCLICFYFTKTKVRYWSLSTGSVQELFLALVYFQSDKSLGQFSYWVTLGFPPSLYTIYVNRFILGYEWSRGGKEPKYLVSNFVNSVWGVQFALNVLKRWMRGDV